MTGELGKRIAKYRKKKNITQSKLAEITGVDDKTVSRWETGRTIPDVFMLKEIASALEISLVELIDVDNEENNYDLEEIDKLIYKTIDLFMTKEKPNKKKRLLLKVFLVFIFVIVTFSCCYVTYDITKNKCETKVYQFGADGDKHVYGYYIEFSDKYIFKIDGIGYIDKTIGTNAEKKTETIEVEVLSDGKLLFSERLQEDKSVSIYKLLSDYKTEFIIGSKSDEYKKIDKNNTYLKVRYGKDLEEEINIQIIINEEGKL